MTLFGSPEAHTANPPATWTVTKLSDRLWALQTADGGTLDTQPTKTKAEALKSAGFYFDLYGKEARWYAGEQIPKWRPWAEVKAEQERHAAWLAEKSAAKSESR